MRKKIVYDMALNIVATAIPVVVLQLIILPQLSHQMSGDEYGLLVTILAFLNVVPAAFGNSLNNIRLIQGGEETKPDEARNYSSVLAVLELLNIAIFIAFLLLYENGISWRSMALDLLVAALWLMREYHIVAFRIKLNYRFIVYNNLIMVLGYIVGFLLFLRVPCWQIIYICGQAASLTFIFYKSSLWREPLKTDSKCPQIFTQTILLIASGMLMRITTYADKMLIFPILGGTEVSVYYTATLFGKVVSLTITPVSGVILSYLSKTKQNKKDTFTRALVLSSIIGVAGYFFCILISRPVLSWIYPQFVDSAMKYIWITTGTMVLIALISIVNPFVLKYFSMKWQIIINGAYAALYVSLSMAMLQQGGLMGFCFGALIATATKFILMILIYEKLSSRHAMVSP